MFSQGADWGGEGMSWKYGVLFTALLSSGLKYHSPGSMRKPPSEDRQLRTVTGKWRSGETSSIRI